jgi:23S rRNA (cytosine1962-C5)-methyltransferase
MASIRIKPGREKSLLRRHPWIFSGAITTPHETYDLGETVDVLDSGGNFLARAAYSPQSKIRARVWSWTPGQAIDEAFFRGKIAAALAFRKSLIAGQGESEAIRLIYAESDGLPGLIVDRYGDTLVFQVLTAGIERWRDLLADLLLELSGANRIVERSDVDVRALEGLPKRTGVLRGSEYPSLVDIEENGIRYRVDALAGHKTGFYLDQRVNRYRLRQIVAGWEVLDCFSYTGGFALSALAGGADFVTAIESSAEAIGLARQNLDFNEFPAEKIEWEQADVFNQLRLYRDQARSFDVIVLDPPKFAPTAAQSQRAARGYKDINLLAFKLLRPGGLLMTFSCSGGISAELFQKIVAGAALDAGVEGQIIDRLQQGPDHPVSLTFPESEYLKGFLIRVG